MAWSYEVTATVPVGDKWLVCGVWDSAGVTGGDIVTGFNKTHSAVLGHTGSAVEAAAAVINETITADAPGPGSLTVVATSGDAGTFIAVCS